jgi:cytochrome c peroxidase
MISRKLELRRNCFLIHLFFLILNEKPMKKFYFLFSLLVVLFTSCNNNQNKDQAPQKEDSVLTLAKTFFQPLPAEAVNPDNPITPEKVALGKTLYYDNRLSMHNTQSCNTCHNLATFGVDNKPTSTGDLGKNGKRNSPTTLNAALHFHQFWDGRMKDVEEQAGGPMMNPVEMNMPSEKEVLARLSKSEGYKKMFAAAYPSDKDPMTFRNIRNAIAAFERTLITPSKFDKYLSGDATALNEQEVTGLKTFMGAGCTACHTGSLLGGTMFQKFPLIGTDYKSLTGSTNDDKGKMEVSKLEADKYIFKVSSLRNIAETGPYFHDGSVKDLDTAITIMAKLQLGKEITPEQNNDIAVFLKSLTGDVPADAKQNPVLP